MNARIYCGILLAFAASDACSAEPNRIVLEATETAGVHRDGTPTHVLLQSLEEVDRSTNFRILRDGKPVVAQFRPTFSNDKSSDVWLDFVASAAPYATNQYVVEYGTAVEPGPERVRGHNLIESAETFVVSNAPYIDWTVPRDFRGLLQSVRFAPSEHLLPRSVGLSIVDQDGNEHQLGGIGTTASVVREGKMAVALRFEKTESGAALSGVHWSADLVFPGPVSWVDLRLNIVDPNNRVAEARLGLKLHLDEPTGKSRTLVELGAARTVYRSLIGDASVELRADDRADPSWQILRGDRPPLQPFAVGANGSKPAEGWAHIMDRKRCLAIAFEGFGRAGEDRLHVRADGTLTAAKRFAESTVTKDAARKRWRMWLHFVQFPPQQSASTDPYMMQNPLVVRQVKR
jgi:hypothetical protein